MSRQPGRVKVYIPTWRERLLDAYYARCEEEAETIEDFERFATEHLAQIRRDTLHHVGEAAQEILDNLRPKP